MQISRYERLGQKLVSINKQSKLKLGLAERRPGETDVSLAPCTDSRCAK